MPDSVIEPVSLKHPINAAKQAYHALVGIDDQKEMLIDLLETIIKPEVVAGWLRKHHASGLPFYDESPRPYPLILFSGDVGCGKTALANSAPSIAAEKIGTRILVIEAPPDIRGNGYVGNMGVRIAEIFAKAKSEARTLPTILIIDEADDIGSSREQNQAHHEDRAGVNVILKQLDDLGETRHPVIVFMITNRAVALDPALKRRAALTLTFKRPDKAAREQLVDWILRGVKVPASERSELLKATDTKPPMTFSDIVSRAAHLALRMARTEDIPFSGAVLLQAIKVTRPTAEFREEGWE